MKKIGLLSDTHGYWDDRYVRYFSSCDEIWHAGDIGSLSLLDKIADFKPVRAVYGNIDGQDIRMRLKPVIRFMCEEVEVLMTHIGGKPGKYAPEISPLLQQHAPRLFICGHSHILQVKFDKRHNMLYINPGAAGKYGFHAVRTLIRFVISGNNISDLEVIELEKLL